jgi:hypothetical protein
MKALPLTTTYIAMTSRLLEFVLAPWGGTREGKP